jgi:predicted dithiol-disulfide oxidoreductase (DUF899 family)
MNNTQTITPARELVVTNKAQYPNESAESRAARNQLLVEEIELRRRLEHVALHRRALPSCGEIPQDFQLASDINSTRFSSLFGDKNTVMIYSMMCQREFSLARSQPQHLAPQPKAPTISPPAGLHISNPSVREKADRL